MPGRVTNLIDHGWALRNASQNVRLIMSMIPASLPDVHIEAPPELPEEQGEPVDNFLTYRVTLRVADNYLVRDNFTVDLHEWLKSDHDAGRRVAERFIAFLEALRTRPRPAPAGCDHVEVFELPMKVDGADVLGLVQCMTCGRIGVRRTGIAIGVLRAERIDWAARVLPPGPT